ncbi:MULTISPECIES: hypothetical protein [Alphaproteobacteria]|uniref:hypothetical protein n=1 Tax=Alphaproteobacteria TaxID=28211 RepID=UPI003A95C374
MSKALPRPQTTTRVRLQEHRYKPMRLVLKGGGWTASAGEQVAAELQARYGFGLDVINYPEGQRPTSGEMNSEMFGGSIAQYEGMSSD